MMSLGALELRPNPSAWVKLLDLALPALDQVFPDHDLHAQAGAPRWTLGGGTAIALRIGHRASDDIDLFVPATPLKAFTPAENPAAAAISAAFQYPGHYLKFEREDGEIDFLAVPLQTTPGFTIETFKGRLVALETLEEVIVKKIRYRAARFAPRDVFDLACVAQTVPDLVTVLRDEVGDALPRLAVAVEALGAVDFATIELRESSAWRSLKNGALDVARKTIKTAREL
jgi:hypothetical protein